MGQCCQCFQKPINSEDNSSNNNNKKSKNQTYIPPTLTDSERLEQV